MKKDNWVVQDYSRDVYKGLTKFGKYVYHSFFHGGYVGAIISGGFGIGKSMSAIHLGREIAQAVYGVNRFQGFQIALENMIFTMDEVIDATDNLGSVEYWENVDPFNAIKRSHAIRKPFFIWDDAGMHGSKYKHFIDMDDSYELQSNFDTIRDVTSCMIITVPEDDELLKFLRNYRGNYMVEIIKMDADYDRRLEFWKYGKDRLGRKKKYHKWSSQPFSIFVDNFYYGQYKKMKNIAKIENKKRYENKKKLKEIKAKYFETRQKYYQLKMEKEMSDLEVL